MSPPICKILEYVGYKRLDPFRRMVCWGSEWRWESLSHVYRGKRCRFIEHQIVEGDMTLKEDSQRQSSVLDVQCVIVTVGCPLIVDYNPTKVATRIDHIFT